MIETPVKSRRERTLEILTGFTGAIFIFAGLFKLAGIEEWAVRFDAWDYPHLFQLAIGGIELVGGVMLMFRKLSSLVAVGLGVLMVGAIYTHVARGAAIYALVPLMVIALLAVVGITRWPEALGRAERQAS